MSCCQCSAWHYDGECGGSVPQKPSIVSHSETSEAIDHVSMRSATATVIEGNGRDVVVRSIASELDAM
jgi:hypothetical protein